MSTAVANSGVDQLAAPRHQALVWQQWPSIPDERGFAGAFAGVHINLLLVAGGANFPDRPPWEGGVKTWYGQVWALKKDLGQWQPAGRLPRPLGYGISLSTPVGVGCLGGSV
jgi:N-acetylneuraminic acid mutarotase